MQDCMILPSQCSEPWPTSLRLPLGHISYKVKPWSAGAGGWPSISNVQNRQQTDSVIFFHKLRRSSSHCWGERGKATSPSRAGLSVVLVVDIGVAHLDPSSVLLRLDLGCCFHLSLHKRSLSLCDRLSSGEEVEAVKMRKGIWMEAAAT